MTDYAGQFNRVLWTGRTPLDLALRFVRVVSPEQGQGSRRWGGTTVGTPPANSSGPPSGPPASAARRTKLRSFPRTLIATRSSGTSTSGSSASTPGISPATAVSSRIPFRRTMPTFRRGVAGVSTRDIWRHTTPNGRARRHRFPRTTATTRATSRPGRPSSVTHSPVTSTDKRLGAVTRLTGAVKRNHRESWDNFGCLRKT